MEMVGSTKVSGVTKSLIPLRNVLFNRFGGSLTILVYSPDLNPKNITY